MFEIVRCVAYWRIPYFDSDSNADGCADAYNIGRKAERETIIIIVNREMKRMEDDLVFQALWSFHVPTNNSLEFQIQYWSAHYFMVLSIFLSWPDLGTTRCFVHFWFIFSSFFSDKQAKSILEYLFLSFSQSASICRQSAMYPLS